MAPSPFFLLLCRLAVAALTAALALLGAAQAIAGQGPMPALLVMPALLATAAVWLLFGIRTRVVVLVAVGLGLGYAFLANPAQEAARGPQVMAILLFGLAVPLVLHGGGSLCMLRKGWADML